jgi:hypothetical protein
MISTHQIENANTLFGQPCDGFQRKCARHGAVHHHAALTGSRPLSALRVVAVDVGAAVMWEVVFVSTVLGSMLKRVCCLCLQFQKLLQWVSLYFKQSTMCHTLSVRVGVAQCISSGLLLHGPDHAWDDLAEGTAYISCHSIP